VVLHNGMVGQLLAVEVQRCISVVNRAAKQKGI
jgi:hypothetical protein